MKTRLANFLSSPVLDCVFNCPPSFWTGSGLIETRSTSNIESNQQEAANNESLQQNSIEELQNPFRDYYGMLQERIFFESVNLMIRNDIQFELGYLLLTVDDSNERYFRKLYKNQGIARDPEILFHNLKI